MAPHSPAGDSNPSLAESQMTDPICTVVGCFTTSLRKARGKGLSLFDGLPQGEPALTLEGPPNPSYLVAAPHRGMVFSAHADTDIVGTYAVDPATGVLRLSSEARTGGANGVSLALHPSGRFLYVANYASGSISTMPIGGAGVEDATQVLELPGAPGPHREQQSTSHPHHSVFDPSGQFLIVPDKGLDRIFVLLPDDGDGTLSAHSGVATRAGVGPRHIAFHAQRPRAYVVGELDGSVTVLDWNRDAGILTPLCAVPSLPPSYFGPNTAAEIVVSPSGRSLFVSHRGADVIAHLSLERPDELPEIIEWLPSGGACPRFMTLTPDGRQLLVANEESDNLALFTLGSDRERLVQLRQVASPSPAAIAFL